MNSYEQDKELIIQWLADNRDLLGEHLEDTKNQYEQYLIDEPNEVHDDIAHNFKQTVEFLTQVELQKHLNVSLESVILIFEDIDIVDYLYGKCENEYVQYSDQ